MSGVSVEGFHNVGSPHVFLFGMSMTIQSQPGHAWVARVRATGDLLWCHDFHPGRAGAGLEGSAVEPVQPGFLPITYLFDGTMLGDGSLVFVGQTGILNKFGQGASRLWFLRIDRSGKQLAEAFVDLGRVFPAGRHLIAACVEGIIAPYTTQELPPIAGAPGNAPRRGPGIRVVHLDENLRKRWDEPFGKTMMPGAATLTGPAPFVLLTTAPRELLIQSIDATGEIGWKARMPIGNRFVTPVASLRRERGVVAVFQCRDNGPALSDELQKVLLVELTAPDK